MKVPLRVLFIEDFESDVDLIIRQIKKAGYSVPHERVKNAKEMKTALEKQTWDLVISDYKLSRFSARTALSLLQKSKYDIPFIVVSDSVGEEAAVELIKLGADDCLIKDKLERLVPIVERELAEAQIRRERKQSEVALREREERLALIYNNVSDVIFTIAVEPNNNFRFISVNNRFMAVTGLSEDQIVGRLAQDVIPKSAHALVFEKYKEAIRTRQRVHWEEVSQYPTGKKIGEVSVAPIFDAKNRCTKLIGTVHDITERKQNEEALKEAELKFRSIFDSASDGILLARVSDRRFSIANNKICEMLGYREEELLKLSISDIHPKESLPYVAGQFEKQLRKEILTAYDIPVLKKDGTTFYADINSLIINIDRNDYLLGIFRDVTEYRKAKEELINERYLTNMLLDNVPDHIYFKDIESRFIRVNKSQAVIFGLSDPADVVGKTDFDFFTAQHAQSAFNDEQKIIKTGQSLIGFEEKETWTDGRETWVSTTKMPLRDREGKIIGTFGISKDITERKRAEEEVRKSDIQFRKLASQVPGMIFQFMQKPDGTFCVPYTSERIKDIFGCSPQDVLDDFNPITKTILPEDLNIVIDSIKKSADQLTPWQCEYRVQIPGRQIRWMFGQSIPEKQKDGSIIWHGFNTDITERKRVEEQLHDSMQMFQGLFNTSPDAIILIDPNDSHTSWPIIDCNDAACKMNGYTHEELVGNSIDVFSSVKGTREERIVFLENLRQKGTIYTENYHCHKDGHIFPIEISNTIITLGGREFVLGIDRDITERKRAEEALQESRQMFHDLFNVSPDSIVLIDPNNSNVSWPIVDCNEATCKMNGYTREELVGHSIDVLNITVGTPEERAAYLENLQKNGTVHVETFHRRKDGHIFPIEVTTSIVTLVGHEMVLGIDRDITERKKAENGMKESEERYRRLVEFSPDAIVVHSEGKIVYVNPATITLLGANSASELIGKSFLDIIHPDYRDSIHQQIIAVMKENYAFPLTEEKFIRLDGSVVDVEVAAIPIVYKEKSSMQIVARDISEQKKLQNQLVQTQKIQSIGTLAGGIAHDFNNILGIILAYSSLLDTNKLTPDKFSASITAIDQAVRRGAALVRQILTFARKTDIIFELINISELIHELLSMLDQTFPKTITFSEKIENNIPLIFADRTQVHQAILNLCINARDAMPHGGLISIIMEKQTKEQMHEKFPNAGEEEYVCISVTDTGTGMDEATCQKVFDPFFTTKEKGKGTGLGLSVVYGVVQAHHGFINLKSELDHGTTFWLYFPVQTVNKQTADDQQPFESFEIGGTETILLVEDEEMLIQMVSFLLESKGYNVLCAHDGLEAVSVYQSHKNEIALVVTDMGLPVLTGIDEFKKIKEINPHVKVIFASGYFEPDVKSELLKDGANGFIQKPYEPDYVLRLIRQVLDKKDDSFSM